MRRRWLTAAAAALVLLAGCEGGAGSEMPAETAAEESAESQELTVPDLIGEDLPDALAALRDVGLHPISRDVTSDAPVGVVVRQAPAAGTTLPPDDPVIVEVSAGPDDGRDPSPGPDGDSHSAGEDREVAAPPVDGTVPLQLVDSGFSWAPWGSDGAPAVSAAAVIRNDTDLVGRAFRVTYVVRDASGAARGSQTEWVRYAAPRSTMYVSYRMYLDPGSPPASLEVTVEPPGVSPVPVPPSGGFSNVRYAQDDVFGEWSNPTGETVSDWLLACVAFSGDEVVGGGWTITDLVPAHTSTAFRLGNGLVPGMRPDAFRCSAWDDVVR